jgi:hypothetical protein
MYNGMQIKSLAVVKPIAGMETSHQYDPGNFQPVSEVQDGEYGMYIAPAENTPTGAVAGVEYPVHRDDASLRRYVILRVEQAPTTIGGEPTPEVRYWIDTETPTTEQAPANPDVVGGPGAQRQPRILRPRTEGPADGDDDLSPDERL